MNKGKYNMKKWSNPIGDSHKKKIFEIIQKNSLNGVYQHEIIKESKLSRQTVYTILNKLMIEGEIYKGKGNKYFVASDDPININLLAASANIQLRKRIFKEKHLISGISDAICKCSFKDLTEKYVFEFANIIGAFTIYVMIESMRPGEISKQYKKRVNLIEYLFNNTIPLNEIFYKLYYYLGININNRLYDDISKNEFDKIHKAFMKVYPDIHNDLDKGWESMCELILTSRNDNKQKYCHHEWDERYLYKYGKYYQCRKCYYKTITKKK